jgi:hypothetical protein
MLLLLLLVSSSAVRVSTMVFVLGNLSGGVVRARRDVLWDGVG